MDVILAHKVEILAFLLALSEILGSFEYFKSSSVFEMIVNFLKALKPAPKE